MDLLRDAGIWQIAGLMILGVVGLAALFKSHRSVLLVVGCMLFIAGLGLTKEISTGGGVEYRTFMFALQVRRALAYSALGGALVLAMLLYAPKIRFSSTSSVLWMMLLTASYMGLIHIMHDPGDGIMTLAVAIVTFVPFTLLLPAMIESWDDLYTPARAIVLTGGAWTIASTIQFLINRSVILAGSDRRFCGMLGNPQHAAVFCSSVAVIGIWLGLNDPKLRFRLLWIAIGAANIVFTAWSGSRTGALCLVAGLSIAFVARAGRAVLLAPVVVGAVFGLVTLATSMGVQFGFERLLDTTNTRSGAWGRMIEQIKQSPIVGVGPSNQQFSENSFLLAWSSFGIGAFALMILVFFCSFIVGVRLIRLRFSVAPKRRAMIDLIGALMVMYWMGAMAEGYGASRISTQLVIYVLIATMATRAVAIGREEVQAAEEGGRTPDESLYDEYEWYGDELPASHAGRDDQTRTA